MKRIFRIVSIIAIASLTIASEACTNKNNTEQNNGEELVAEDEDEDVTEWVEIEKIVPPAVVPETETFYNMDSASALVISDPITYEVQIKNYVPDDDWKDECLANTNRKALANAIFQAVYKGRLTPIDYFTDTEMPIDSVKALEKKFSRDEIGNIMFTEKWYFSENTLKFTKEVISVTMGYELLDRKTKEHHGFRPVFMVKLK